VLAARAHAIGAALVPVVQPIYAAIQRAIRVLQALPALTRFEQQEAEEFAYYMKHINGGGAIAVREGGYVADSNNSASSATHGAYAATLTVRVPARIDLRVVRSVPVWASATKPGRLDVALVNAQGRVVGRAGRSVIAGTAKLVVQVPRTARPGRYVVRKGSYLVC